MAAIWRRELQAYFKTSIGYVFMGFFLLISGLLFFLINLGSGSTNITNFLNNYPMVLMLLVPVLTMRLFSEERKNKSEQMLLTSPLSLTSIVVGKFLAALTVYCATLAVTLLYQIIIGIYGRIYWGEVITGYLGCFMMGGCYIAIGVLISSMTENQVVSALATLGIGFLIWVIDMVLTVIPVRWVVEVLSWLSLISRFEVFLMSQLSVAGILYYLSFAAVFLFLTVRVVDARRWSEG